MSDQLPTPTDLTMTTALTTHTSEYLLVRGSEGQRKCITPCEPGTTHSGQHSSTADHASCHTWWATGNRPKIFAQKYRKIILEISFCSLEQLQLHTFTNNK